MPPSDIARIFPASRYSSRANASGAPRCFRVDAGIGARQDAIGGQQVDQRFIDLFNPVISLLVVAIDRALDGSDAAVRDIRTAGDVFFVPQQEVVLMLLTYDAQ